MAGGGHIIIRKLIKQAAQGASVRENLFSPHKLSRFDEIMAKDEADWTHDETHFMHRCVAEAYDNVS